MNVDEKERVIDEAEITKQLLISSANSCDEYLQHAQLSSNLRMGAECIAKLLQLVQVKKEGS